VSLSPCRPWRNDPENLNSYASSFVDQSRHHCVLMNHTNLVHAVG